MPTHWALEVANGFVSAARRQRISQSDITLGLSLAGELPVTIDDQTGDRASGETASLALQYGLTVYDAAFLELSMRRGADLATEDKALAKAAAEAGVSVFGGTK